MNADFLRLAAGAAIVWFAFGGSIPGVPGVPGVTPYVGSLTALHQAAGSMEGGDRVGLSSTLDAAATMIESDRANAIATTEQLQAAIRATLAFGHTAFSTQKYPGVASALQAELEKASGVVRTRLSTLAISTAVRRLSPVASVMIFERLAAITAQCYLAQSRPPVL